MDALTIAAASGFRSRMQSLDLLANNLANAATTGFERDQEYYGTYASEDSDAGSSGAPGSTLPVIEKQWTDFSPGNIQVTGNPLDIALSGKGFLAVNGPNGTLYTRSGNLQVRSTGELATAEGYPVRGTAGTPIQILPGKPITISPDGEVRQEGQAVGQMEIVDFKSTDSLRKMGSMCFKNTDVKNLPIAPKALEVQQGKIEGSNVPVAEAAMRLVGVMRQFEMLQKAISVSTEMDTKSIQEVARVGN